MQYAHNITNNKKLTYQGLTIPLIYYESSATCFKPNVQKKKKKKIVGCLFLPTYPGFLR